MSNHESRTLTSGKAELESGRGPGSQAGNKDPDKIEKEIARTRASLSATLEELENRFSPKHLLERGLERVDPQSLAGPVRDNVVPLALLGIAVIWLVLRNRPTPATASRRATPRSSRTAAVEAKLELSPAKELAEMQHSQGAFAADARGAPDANAARKTAFPAAANRPLWPVPDMAAAAGDKPQSQRASIADARGAPNAGPR